MGRKHTIIAICFSILAIGGSVSCSFQASHGTYDSTAPSTPPLQGDLKLNFKTHEDLTTSPELKWTGIVDQSGLGFSHYEVALGTIENLESVVPWLNVGFTTSYSFSNIDLIRGKKYVMAIRAVDKGGNKSSPIISSEWFAEPKVSQYSVEPTNLKVDDLISHRYEDSAGNEYLFGLFKRYNHINLECFAELDATGVLNAPWSESVYRGCSGEIKKIVLQTVGTEKYIILGGTFTKVGAVSAPGLMRVKASAIESLILHSLAT